MNSFLHTSVGPSFLNKSSESSRACHQRLSSSGHLVAMNALLLVTSLLVLGLVAGQEEARAKPKKCPSETVNKDKLFKKWTETDNKGKPVADAPCWFDLTRFVLCMYCN